MPGKLPALALAALLAAGLWSFLPPLAGREEPPPATRLTSDGGFKQNLQWSPDGKRLLLTRIHKGKMALWTMSADGGALTPLLVPDPDTPHFDGHW
jgi:TolB protein